MLRRSDLTHEETASSLGELFETAETVDEIVVRRLHGPGVNGDRPFADAFQDAQAGASGESTLVVFTVGQHHEAIVSVFHGLQGQADRAVDVGGLELGHGAVQHAAGDLVYQVLIR